MNKTIDELKLDLASLDLEVDKLDRKTSKNIREYLILLHSDVEYLDNDLRRLKKAWEPITNIYFDLDDVMERF